MLRAGIRNLWIGMGLTLTAVMAGCGGGGGGAATPTAGLTASFYAGHWTGTWESEEGKRGTLDVTVDSEGRSTGWVTDEATGQTGRTTGRVGVDGQISDTWRFTEGAAIRVLGPSRLAGRDDLQATLSATQDYVDIAPIRVKLLRHYH